MINKMGEELVGKLVVINKMGIIREVSGEVSSDKGELVGKLVVINKMGIREVSGEVSSDKQDGGRRGAN